MRTTIRMAPQVLAEATKRAAETGRTLTAVSEDALRESLARRPARRAATRVQLRTAGSGGLQPGVDLDDSAALIALMERRR